MQINQDEMEKALYFLSTTDDEYARAKSYFFALERELKTIAAIEFNKADGSASARKEIVPMTQGYQDHLSKMQDAEYTYLLLQQKRNTAATTIDCWRSLNAARSRGM